MIGIADFLFEENLGSEFLLRGERYHFDALTRVEFLQTNSYTTRKFDGISIDSSVCR